MVNEELHEALVEAESARDWLPTGTLAGIIEEHSDFKTDHTAGKWHGMMPVHENQLQRFGLKPEDMHDWRTNLRAGVTMLDNLYSKYQDIGLSLLALRAGEGAVNDLISPNVNKNIENIRGRHRDFVLGAVARSAKYGGQVKHSDLQSLATVLGVSNLDKVYRKGNLKGPDLPDGLMPDVLRDAQTDSNIRQALDEFIGQTIEEDPLTGEKLVGPKMSQVFSLITAPGLPQMDGDLMPEIPGYDPLYVPPAVGRAFGLVPTEQTIKPLERQLRSMWREV